MVTNGILLRGMPPKQTRSTSKAVGTAEPTISDGTGIPNKRQRRGTSISATTATPIQLPHVLEYVVKRKFELVDRNVMLTNEELLDAKNAIKELASLVKAGSDGQDITDHGRDILQQVKNVFDICETLDEEGSSEFDQDDHIAEDICVVGGRTMRESEIKCPLSMKVMVHPLKK